MSQQPLDLHGLGPERHDHGCRRLLRLPPSWEVDAIFGGDRDQYRYRLTHRWGPGNLALFAMMNPSGASEAVGDSTVMLTAGIAQTLGYGGQIIVNACAYRAVNPRSLLMVADPVGPHNLDHIDDAGRSAALVVIAHGLLPKPLRPYAAMMCRTLEAIQPLHVLRLTQNGIPMHPMVRGKNRITKDTKPYEWGFVE